MAVYYENHTTRYKYIVLNKMAGGLVCYIAGGAFADLCVVKD
jgi:hypothetical protein